MSAPVSPSAPMLIAAIVAAVRAGDDHQLTHLIRTFSKAADTSAAFALRRALIGDRDTPRAPTGRDTSTRRA
ncbi:hypothetical protein ACFWP3_37970 [Streptomyces sp. NPDC058525]|uniref:hypothetical protein n=1 Tax=Streptomyces sp. NPDC058525 TaxID=3346538 RepID=UPI0036622307